MRIYKAFILTFISMFLLGGCTSDIAEPIPREIQILLRVNQGTVHQGYIFFRIVDDSVLETYTLGPLVSDEMIDSNIVFDTGMLDNFVSEFGDRVVENFPDAVRLYNSTQRILSQRQLNNIWTLAENVGECDFYTWVGWGFNLPRVWVIIDGEMLWSHFTSDTQDDMDDINGDLLHLVHYFIDLSPIACRE